MLTGMDVRRRAVVFHSEVAVGGKDDSPRKCTKTQIRATIYQIHEPAAVDVLACFITKYANGGHRIQIVISNH